MTSHKSSKVRKSGPTKSATSRGSAVGNSAAGLPAEPRFELLCFIKTEPFNLNTPDEVKAARVACAAAGFYLIECPTYKRREGEHGFTPTGLSLQVA